MLYKALTFASIVAFSSALVQPAFNRGQARNAAVDANPPYSVSGLSSGAFFAVQYGVAFSSEVTGIGVVAGGPYYCAQDSLTNALDACMNLPSEINVNTLVTDTKNFASQGKIDAVSNIAKQKVYLYSGTADTVVQSGVVSKCKTYFDDFGATTSFKNDLASQHSMVTNFYGPACTHLGEPYINNCNYDLAGTILKYLYGSLANPVAHNAVPYNNVISIDQTKYTPAGETVTSISMEPTGYIYRPTNCTIAPLAAHCTLHVVFHGCDQYLQAIYNTKPFNDTYVRNTGYNEWAETNRIVLLYPQANKDALKNNPNGCWDWWGYNSKNYAFQDGEQMATVKNMVDYIFG